MGGGESILERMLDGVRRSRLVLMLLSDAYCRSDNCLREASHAFREWKYIIPLLVPRGRMLSSGSNSGWTGPGPGDKQWWRHAEEQCKLHGKSDPDSGEAMQWQLLEAFAPIDLEQAGALDAGSDVEVEIINRILSRFHRGYERQQHI